MQSVGYVCVCVFVRFPAMTILFERCSLGLIWDESSNRLDFKTTTVYAVSVYIAGGGL